MDNSKQQVVDRIKQATNVLVTVNANPTVDQLSACLGLTLFLNKLGKHATAVFSGAVPSTIEFLQPEKTLEKNTDSLRDFIIALDKSKADKLRYKVEDRVVKIFITPYRTSLSDKDLEFSQGDFNVDVVLALGVHQQADLDQAITSHGRILHDATVISINNTPNGNLGSINWVDSAVSSLSELVAVLSDEMNKNALDGQIATALLTGIVAETHRFSNDKTSPQTMSVSAKLMSAGANQQLVATKLEEPVPLPPVQAPPTNGTAPNAVPGQTGSASPSSPAPAAVVTKPDDGTLAISHTDESPTPVNQEPAPVLPSQIHIDEEGTLQNVPPVGSVGASSIPSTQPPPGPGSSAAPLSPSNVTGGSRFVLEPPALGGTLTANSTPEGLDPGTDALSLPQVEQPMLNHDDTPSGAPPAATSNSLSSTSFSPPKSEQTLSDIEAAVHSPHLSAASSQGQVEPIDTPTPGHLNDARSAVADAVSAVPQPLEPIQALSAQPVYDTATTAADTVANTLDMPVPPTVPNLTVPPLPGSTPTDVLSNSSAPPPVPPPLTPFPTPPTQP